MCETKEIDSGGCNLEQKSEGWRKVPLGLAGTLKGQRAEKPHRPQEQQCVYRKRDTTTELEPGMQDKVTLESNRSKTTQGLQGSRQDLDVYPQGSKGRDP